MQSPVARWKAAGAAIVLASTALAASADCRLESPPHRVPLLELYTSEGCNSCPPADRWLARLPAQGYDARKIVTLAFHVDYWNQLGWEDRFSKAGFSARQRQIADRNRSSFVYTPQFVLDGRDWQPWRRSGAMEDSLKTIGRQPSGAIIRASTKRDGLKLAVEGSVKILDQHAANSVVWVALYEDGLQTAVPAGENRGKTLNHERVVRTLAGPLKPDLQGYVALRQQFDLPNEWRPEKLGITVFAENTSTGATLQAAAASACF